MPRKIEYFYLFLALATAGYATFAAINGEVIAYQRVGFSKTISIDSDAERFWGAVLFYFGVAFILVVLGIKKYFPPRLYALLDFGFNSKISMQQVAFIICVAVAMYTTIFWLAGILSNA